MYATSFASLTLFAYARTSGWLNTEVVPKRRNERLVELVAPIGGTTTWVDHAGLDAVWFENLRDLPRRDRTTPVIIRPLPIGVSEETLPHLRRRYFITMRREQLVTSFEQSFAFAGFVAFMREIDRCIARLFW